MFTSDGLALGDALNRETVAAEIEAALVGSVGLVLSVPLTTLVATVLALRLPAETLPAGDICTLTEREQRLCAEQGERDRDGRGKRAKREEERVTSSRIEPKALGSRPSRSLATNERGLGTHIVMRRGRYVPCSCRLDARVAVADPRCPLWTMCERNADLAHSDKRGDGSGRPVLSRDFGRGGQRERAALGVPAYGPPIAGVDDRAAELADALDCRGQVRDAEVRKGSGIAGTGSTIVDSEAQVVGVGLPPRSGRSGPWREGDPEDSVPEPPGAIRIVGWEFDEWRGHRCKYGWRFVFASPLRAICASDGGVVPDACCSSAAIVIGGLPRSAAITRKEQSRLRGRGASFAWRLSHKPVYEPVRQSVVGQQSSLRPSELVLVGRRHRKSDM
jgi:hypothetical protein